MDDIVAIEEEVSSTSSEQVISDEEVARRLQETFDAEVIDLEETLSDEVLAQQLHKELNPDTDTSLEDAQCEVQLVEGTEDSSAVEIADVDSDVEDVETSTGWKIDELGVRFDPSFNTDWQELPKFTPDIKKIWDRLWSLYFEDAPPSTRVYWSSSLGSEGSQISSDEVLFNSDLKVFPRCDLISAILRAQIVAFLTYKRHMTLGSPNFKYNFVRIMKKLNTICLIKVRMSGTLEGQRGVFCRQWYRCTGICQNYAPFHGIFHSEAKPGGQNQWWLTHRTTCGGTLFRVYEASRLFSGTKEYKYLANTSLMKVAVDLKNSPFITPQETLDLTDEQDSHQLDLNQSIDVEVEEDVTDQEPSKTFYKKFDSSLGSDYNGYAIPCPFCKEKIPRKLFPDHLDGCKGFSEKITISARKVGRMHRETFSEPSSSSSFQLPCPKRFKTIVLD